MGVVGGTPSPGWERAFSVWGPKFPLPAGRGLGEGDQVTFSFLEKLHHTARHFPLFEQIIRLVYLVE